MSRLSGVVRGGRSDIELPDEILSLIPTDPFEQLDLVVGLRQKLQEMEMGIHELKGKASRFERDFREADSRLKIIRHDNMNLTKERDSLATTVTDLNREMAKLETFKRKLIQSFSNENDQQTEPVDIRTCDQSVPDSYPDKVNISLCYLKADQRKNVHCFQHSYSKSSDLTHPLDQGPRFSVSPWIRPTRTPDIISPRSSFSAGPPKKTSGAMSPTYTTLRYSEQRTEIFTCLS
ncbi:hypothetical protein ARALYDRAFT_895818 [Arabidopsis lyrata subsp. lyrata]|uniref:Uncharacterized protein n=1 Tax=Arabidopsis lyrata subsp. lyrata TaxID=81972 RepID=D7KVY5_ARALL|nr:hypothetical protein ARALYDRAFT_895818 [Arabidopsis lyrata subsp. lyrata]